MNRYMPLWFFMFGVVLLFPVGGSLAPISGLFWFFAISDWKISCDTERMKPQNKEAVERRRAAGEIPLFYGWLK